MKVEIRETALPLSANQDKNYKVLFLDGGGGLWGVREETMRMTAFRGP